MKRKNNPAVAILKGNIHQVGKWPAPYAVEHPIEGGDLYVDFFRNPDEALGWALRRSRDWHRCNVYGKGGVVMAQFADGKLVGMGGDSLNYRPKKRNPDQWAWVTQYMDQLPRFNDVRDAMKPIYYNVVNGYPTSITADMLRRVVKAVEGIEADKRSTGFLDNATKAAWPVIEKVGVKARQELKRRGEWAHGAKANPRAVYTVTERHGRPQEYASFAAAKAAVRRPSGCPPLKWKVTGRNGAGEANEWMSDDVDGVIRLAASKPNPKRNPTEPVSILATYNASHAGTHPVLDLALEIANLAKNLLPVPYVATRISQLGGAHRASTLISLSLDPREAWQNGIYENSRHAKFSVSPGEGTIELITGWKVPKFRKTRFKTSVDAMEKIAKWLGDATKKSNPRHNPGLGDYWAAGKRAAAGAVASAAESARATVEAAKRAAADEAAKVRVQPLTEEQAIRFLAKQHGIINPRKKKSAQAKWQKTSDTSWGSGAYTIEFSEPFKRGGNWYSLWRTGIFVKSFKTLAAAKAAVGK